MANDNKIRLIFIINGEESQQTVNGNPPLQVGVQHALKETGNNRDVSEWEVRNSSGALLDISRSAAQLGLNDGDRLMLSLRVGAGGANCA